VVSREFTGVWAPKGHPNVVAPALEVLAGLGVKGHPRSGTSASRCPSGPRRPARRGWARPELSRRRLRRARTQNTA